MGLFDFLFRKKIYPQFKYGDVVSYENQFYGYNEGIVIDKSYETMDCFLCYTVQFTKGNLKGHIKLWAAENFKLVRRKNAR